MKTCAKCKKTLEESFFQKQDKILKTCSIVGIKIKRIKKYGEKKIRKEYQLTTKYIIQKIRKL